MITWITKAVWFLWTTFAPEQAKAHMQSIAKDFAKVLVLLLALSFGFGIAFFAGLYFFAQWLLLYIDFVFVCYLIATMVSLFLTSLCILLVFRSIVLSFLKRTQSKGNDLLQAFTFKK
jgi:hypothetical protein